MSNAVRLSDALGRDIAIEWFEAVALVREVADRVRDNFGGQSVPELHQIEIEEDGRISVSGATSAAEPVRRLGQLLQAVLVQSEPPVQLRLLMAQTTAPDPPFATIRDYNEALAYFERPDRAGVLRTLYERAVSAPPSADDRPSTIDAIAPLQVREAPISTTSRVSPASRRRAIQVLAAAVVAAAAVAAYWRFAGAGVNARSVSAIAVKASDAVGTAVVSGLSSVSDRVGLGRLAPTDASGPLAPAPPLARTPSKQVIRKPAAAGPPVPVRFQVFDLESPEGSEGSTPRVGAVSPPSSPESSSPLPPSTGRPEQDGTIYSATDAAVSAPIGVRPQLPRALPANISKDQLGQIELIILPDGTVGSVRLVAAPRSVHESMFLSAAKAWQFAPALKDGRPVAYRKRVWLVLQ